MGCPETCERCANVEVLKYHEPSGQYLCDDCNFAAMMSTDGDNETGIKVLSIDAAAGLVGAC